MFKETKIKNLKDMDPKIITWLRENNEGLDTNLMYRFPQSSDNIKKIKYFAVKDYEKALFYDKGELIDVVSGGIYELDKKARIKGTEIVWIDTSFIEIPWGISLTNGIPTMDGYTVGLHGDLKVRINNVKSFYNDIIAGKKEWKVKDLKNWIKSLLHTSLRDIFKNHKLNAILVEDRNRIINLVNSKVTEELMSYGLELETFNIIGLKPPEDAQNILDHDKKISEIKVKLSERELEELLQQRDNIQKHIQELKEKLRKEQDLLLKDRATPEYFEEKKKQIQIFINEAQKELEEINNKITKR